MALRVPKRFMLQIKAKKKAIDENDFIFNLKCGCLTSVSRETTHF